MPIVAYINFKGECREAVEYYAKIFQSPTPDFMTYGDTPEDPNFPMSESTKNMIMHTELIIEGDRVMFSDLPPEMEMVKGNNISLTILTKDPEKVKTYFHAFAQEGTVGMDLQETFWSKLYGFVIDKFGVGWQLNCELDACGTQTCSCDCCK